MASISNDRLQDYAACFSAEDDLTCFEMWNFVVGSMYSLVIRIGSDPFSSQDGQKEICDPKPVVVDEIGCLTTVRVLSNRAQLHED